MDAVSLQEVGVLECDDSISTIREYHAVSSELCFSAIRVLSLCSIGPRGHDLPCDSQTVIEAHNTRLYTSVRNSYTRVTFDVSLLFPCFRCYTSMFSGGVSIIRAIDPGTVISREFQVHPLRPVSVASAVNDSTTVTA